MQCEVGDGVGGGETPAGKTSVNDLETVRDPVDAAGELAEAHAGGGRFGESEHDLGLEPGLDEARQRDDRPSAVDAFDRRAPDRSPDRREDAVTGPDAPVGEADLVAERQLAAGDAQSPDLVSDLEG